MGDSPRQAARSSPFPRRRPRQRLPACILTSGADRTSRAYIADVQLTTSSLAFQSPERVLGGDLSPADDTWAVACTLYTALTGTSPFAGANDSETKQKILGGSPAPLAVFDVGDDDLQHIIDNALVREIGGRTSTVTALRRSLEEWHPDPGVGALSPLDDDDASEGDEDMRTVMRPAPAFLSAHKAAAAPAPAQAPPARRRRRRRGSGDADARVHAPAGPRCRCALRRPRALRPRRARGCPSTCGRSPARRPLIARLQCGLGLRRRARAPGSLRRGRPGSRRQRFAPRPRRLRHRANGGLRRGGSPAARPRRRRRRRQRERPHHDASLADRRHRAPERPARGRRLLAGRRRRRRRRPHDDARSRRRSLGHRAGGPLAPRAGARRSGSSFGGGAPPGPAQGWSREPAPPRRWPSRASNSRPSSRRAPARSRSRPTPAHLPASLSARRLVPPAAPAPPHFRRWAPRMAARPSRPSRPVRRPAP